MAKEYQETEMSKKARKILEREVPVGSFARREVDSLNYDRFLCDRVFDSEGNLDIGKAYEQLGLEEQIYVLLKRCVQWNLTEEQAHEIIKHRYRECFGPGKGKQYGMTGGINMTIVNYPNWCQALEITPDLDFPDWGDKEKAKKSAEYEMNHLEKLVEKERKQ